ncbi:MAG: PfkB family carbohydrate kinase [Candidatus Thorarchaeota archaeon]|jgi:sugar/nucleoside kinase (ribokinase family)
MDIVVIGHLSRDLLVTPDKTRETLGGGAAYAMMAPSVGEIPAGIVSKVGRDFESKYKVQLDRSGLDLTGLHFEGAKSTRFVNEYDSFERRSQRVETKAPPLKRSDIPEAALEAKLVHLCPLLPDEIDASSFEAVTTSGSTVSLDAQGFLREVKGKVVLPRRWDKMERILSMVDILKLDALELEVAVPGEMKLTAAQNLLDLGPEIVLVTRDRAGSTIFTKNEVIEIPLVLADRTVDTTGCGDTYAIGFLIEYDRTQDIRRAGLFGAACASLNLEHVGPETVPNREQVLSRMLSYI